MVELAKIALFKSTGSLWRLLAVIAFVCFVAAFSRWEGNAFPVIRPILIAKAVEETPGVTSFWGYGYKIRDCAFDRVEWYWPSDKKPIRIRFENDAPAMARDPGPYNFGRYRIWIKADDLFSKADGYVYHRCYEWLPFWLTRTRFWRGRPNGPT